MRGLFRFPERIEGRHVLYGLLAFFGVMFFANGVFVYYALDTFNGLATQNAYRKGLSYNDRIAAQAAQAKRGWQPALRYEADRRRLMLEVNDSDGKPVAGLRVAGMVRRPATDRADRTLEMHEIAPALYAAEMDLAPGQWTVMAELYEFGDGRKPAFRHKQRLWVEPSR
jgi:nitrogen fixation protein FixH